MSRKHQRSKFPGFAAGFARTLEEYAIRIARWAMYEFKIDVDDATKLVNAFPTVIDKAWTADYRPEEQQMPDRIVLYIDWLAERMKADGDAVRAQQLMQLITFLRFPRIRRKGQTMPIIP